MSSTSATTMPDRPRRNIATQKTYAMSDRPRRNITARTTASNTSVTSTRNKRTTTHSTTVTKRKRRVVEEAASTSQVNITNQPTSGTTVERRRSKKVKFTQVETSASQFATSSRGDQPSIVTVQETQVASSVVIQDTIPQVTTTTPPVMQPAPKKRGRGRPPKTSNGSIVGQVSRKRGYHAVEEEEHKVAAFKPKRRKGDTFAIPIPIRSQQIGQVYAIGSNDCAQCGMDESTENLKKVRLIPSLSQFNIVDISAGSIHSAALTSDGKIVTWGCNDHGTLGRFTETPKSAYAKEIFDTGNYEIGEENNPTYAEGLNNVNIVKVVSGGNATFAISDQGHLYATGTFKVYGVIGFSYDHNIEQPIFTRYKLFEHLTIVDITAGVDHVLALTKEGDVYVWGNGEAYRLGRKISERRSINPLIPYDLGLKHIEQMYAGSYHNFVIDNNGKILVFGLNNTGQCGMNVSKQSIVPPEKHSLFSKMGEGHKVEEFAVGQHHTLARTQDGRVYSFGRTDYGQLGLGDNVLPESKDTKGRLVTPTVIPGLNSIKFIGAGDNFSMAIKLDNKIYAWGFGNNYVLGNKKEDDATSPFLIPDSGEFDSKDIVRISCGSSHALFLMVTKSPNLGGDAMDIDTN
ncbi:13459_t:CDS:2 [Funneliformis geosporum]|uniref:8887_t:CDS:1 n=1 Tax=Funneliformis geosporum TaxID=1117311 RepID=A0A9W4SQ88_9GLOM|nr:13459_t:CDS:2 [Funneliformis geosporum]CAI2178745.1 8887_t:CDS:2 [Funneliformis geosporum]